MNLKLSVIDFKDFHLSDVVQEKKSSYFLHNFDFI